MGRNLEKDAVEMAAKNQRILEEGFAIFAEHGIDNVTMTDVAKGAGIGISSLYRYYKTKTELVLAIGTWAWQRYLEQVGALGGAEKKTACAAENVAFFLDAFLDLYRNHKDLLRFNQFFNVYLQSEQIPMEKTDVYQKLIRSLETRFSHIYKKGQKDGSIRRDLSEGLCFSTLLHLMLATVTRYAVGLVYIHPETDVEKELTIQRDLLLRWLCGKDGGEEGQIA